MQARLNKNETVNKALKETLNARTLELEQLQRQSSPTPHDPEQASSEHTQGSSHEYNLEQQHYFRSQGSQILIESRTPESIVDEEPNLRLLIDNVLSSSPPKETGEVLQQFEEKTETSVTINSTASNKKSPKRSNIVDKRVQA